MLCFRLEKCPIETEVFFQSKDDLKNSLTSGTLEALSWNLGLRVWYLLFKELR